MSENVNEEFNNETLELSPSTFKFHEFRAEVGEVRLHCHFIKMKDSLYIWIGDSSDSVLEDLSLAIVSAYETVPVSTKLMGPVADFTSSNLAKRLSKKTKKPIYVSYNLPVDYINLPRIEKRIQEEIVQHPELLTF